MIPAAIALLALVIVTVWLGGPRELLKMHRAAYRRMERMK